MWHHASSMILSSEFLLSSIALWILIHQATAQTTDQNTLPVTMLPPFEESFQVMWADDHVQRTDDGHVWNLLLDQATGSGFQSKDRYMFGWFSMKLKLVPGDSAGVVTAYYMSSNNENRDELDFEFLGNRSGQPYVLQTNVYVNGTGGREQRIVLWYDPTERFHTYSVLWNSHQVVFYVDQVPVRVLRNTPLTSEVFPSTQPMYIFSSIWNGDSWATRGGLDKINWEAAPFASSYKRFEATACQWIDPYPACVSTTYENWWNQPPAWTLKQQEVWNYNWVRDTFLVYDYCTDNDRYPTPPVECTVGVGD